MEEISIQVMEPAKITLPIHFSQVAFMNRSYIPQYNQDDSSGFSEKEVYILDTIVSNQIFVGLRNGLTESPLFDLDSIRILQFRRKDTIDFLKPLSQFQLRAIRHREQAEALISLEYYQIRDTIDVDLYYMDYMAFRQLISKTIWRLYDMTRDSIFDEYLLNDTVQWYSIGEDPQLAVENLPEFIRALRMTAYNAGYKYGQRISPAWFEVPRFYHVFGGKAMRDARRMAASLDWKGASEIWKKLAYQDNEKRAAKACFNMALVCEIEDLLIPALDWAIKSYLIKQDPVTKEYIDLLKERYEKQKIIKDQLPEEG
jgi:hypothetical protein